LNFLRECFVSFVVCCDTSITSPNLPLDSERISMHKNFNR
jgi:hypothetical protein